MIAGSTGIASANEKPSVYDELARLNPGTTSAQMQKSVTAFAKKNKRPVSVVARETLAEAKEYAGESESQLPATAAKNPFAGTKVKVPKAAIGDIFWWNSRYNHVGLYMAKNRVVHIPNKDSKVVRAYVSNLASQKAVKVMFVNDKNRSENRISKKKRKIASDFAEKQVGKKYNTNLVGNKVVKSKTYNCSQLVWAAWKHAAKVDLDNGLTMGVYPNDIVEDWRTHVYKKLT